MRDPNLSVYLNCMLHTNNFDNTRTAWLVSPPINYTLLSFVPFTRVYTINKRRDLLNYAKVKAVS